MSALDHSDHDHLIKHASATFPGAAISVSYTDDEIIHIDVDTARFTCEIGSDDDEYVFSGGERSFRIPLMDCRPQTSNFLGFLLTRLPNPS